MSEVITNRLPEGWADVQLSDLTKRITKGSTPTSYGYEYKSDGVKFVKAENIDTTGYATTTTNYIDDETHEFLSRSKLEENDLLFSIAGTIGRVGVVRDIDLPANTNQALAIIRLHDDSLDIKYLFYYLYSPQIQTVALKNIVGVGRANLSLKNIGEFRVPVAPPEQQKRIVAKIEELFSHIDAGIEALKKAKQLLKQYRQSVLKAAVTGELTKEWREARLKDDSQGSANVAGGTTPGATKLEPATQLLERILKERRQKWEEQQLEQFKAKGKMPKDDKWKGKYKEPLGYSYEGELPENPDSWTWVSPEQVSSTDDYSLAIGPFGSNLKVSDYREEGVPLVFVRNIRAHDYSTENAKYVTHKKAKELRAHSISAGDVLITKMGEPPGDASIYPPTAPDAIITADCIKWRFSNLIECPELFVHIINSQIIKDQILKRTKGVAQKKISLGTFKSVVFPLPPLEEQAEILRVLEQKFYASDRLLKELDVQLLKTEKNKQSILASSFSGWI